MGRHNTPDPAAHLPVRTRLGRFLARWIGWIGFGLVAGAGTVAVIVPVAAWVASTVPGPDSHR